MATIKKMAERKCGSFKGDAKSQCIDNYVRNFNQSRKRRHQKDIVQTKKMVKKYGKDEKKWPGVSFPSKKK
tara:strand:- start:1154 stop:1366 length:213 start_codon:yes stop_codon:yes gene_type:complete